MWKHRLNGISGAAQVHTKIPVPHLIRDILKKALACHAGIVHQQLHRTQLILCGADHPVHSGAVGDIGPKGHGFQSLTAEVVHKILRGLPVL